MNTPEEIVDLDREKFQNEVEFEIHTSPGKCKYCGLSCLWIKEDNKYNLAESNPDIFFHPNGKKWTRTKGYRKHTCKIVYKKLPPTVM